MSYRRFLKPGWLILFLIAYFSLYKGYHLLFGEFDVHQTIHIEKGDTMTRFLQYIPTIDRLRVRWYLYQHTDALDTLQLGSYTLSGTYTPASLIDTINQGSQQSYTKITILEGRSIYDIDAMLTKKGLIQAGEYLNKVSGPSFDLQYYLDRYPYLFAFVSQQSLEGVLYPDTYHLEQNQNIVDQLIKLQLGAFRAKVYKSYNSQIESFSSRLQENGYSLTLSPYQIVTLASIIEKEERNLTNKPIIASIFLNRLQNKMRLDADITLCYGLSQAYESCTPDMINRSIADTINIYNTRVHAGLTPTPIANPSVSTFSALLGFQKTDYLFYLHDAVGDIHYASDIQGHNINKSKYL